MAESKQAVAYGMIMANMRKGMFAPVYVLMGDESYYIDMIANYVADNALKPEEKDFNLSVVFGADVSAKQVVDMARRYPMMSERQVVVVKEAQDIRNIDALETYLKNPMKTTVLVWCYKNGTLDKRKKSNAAILAMAGKMGVVFESKKLKDWELPGFIMKYLQSRQVQIDNKSVQMIADHVGSDLNRLSSELDKLLLSLDANNKNITPDVVEQQIGVSKDFNGFELRNAVVVKNVFKANQIIKYFDTNPKAGNLYSLLPLLFKYFQNLMIAYYAPNRNSEAEVAKYLDLSSPWAAKDYIAGMKNYPAWKTMQIIHKIRETDAKSKGLDNPNTPAGDLMKELIFFILH